MKKYEKPKAEVIEIKNDVIVTSNGGPTGTLVPCTFAV